MVEEHRNKMILAIKCLTVLPWCATCSCWLCGHFAGLIRFNRGFNESYTFPLDNTKHRWLIEFSLTPIRKMVKRSSVLMLKSGVATR